MGRVKIDYGIDLGTTNSAIARIENGEPIIKKTDTLKDTMPSCIHYNRKQALIAGDRAYTLLDKDMRTAYSTGNYLPNTFIEFKRTMGTDKMYHCSNLCTDLNSEELSAEVLKTLKSFVTDEEVNSIVITVPAKFTINQKDATTRAAKLAGFKHCELLQEPIAASMAYGLGNANKDGFWLVFDFGGGTFDAALLKVEDGIMKVIDTEGDNYLGGKNLDYALVDEFILPYLVENFDLDNIVSDIEKKEQLRNAWKAKAEEAKIQLSFKESHDLLTDLGEDYGEDDNGEPLELDVKITHNDLERIFTPIFQRSIDICLSLLKRNNLTGNNLSSLILIGGPTYSPILRKMLQEQITSKLDTTTDPMTAVAKGAALYASTINISNELIEETRDKTKIQLNLAYEATTVEMQEFVAIKVLTEKTAGVIPERLFAEVVRGDKAWSSGKIEINDKGEIVEVKLNEGKSNSFTVFVYDDQGTLLPNEPGEFTIIQGSKIGSATLPYDIGIEIKQRSSGKVVFHPIRNLERNQSLPVTGVANGLKTQKQLRPGNSSDSIKIPIYQGSHGAAGSRAIYNEHVYDVIVTGDDIPGLLPEGSEVDLTLSCDNSERVTGTAYFPYLDHTIEIVVPSDTVQKEISAEWLEKEIKKAKNSVRELESNDHTSSIELTKLEEELSYLTTRFEQGRGDADRKKEVLEGLRKSLKKIDELNDATEWPKLDAELKDEFERLEKANKELGNEKTSLLVNQLRQQVDQVIRDKNVKNGQAVLEEVSGLFFNLTLIYQMMGMIRSFNRDFETLHWKDRSRARQLINQGLQIIGDQPSEEALRPIILDLYDLLPISEKPSGDDDVLTL
ncbi:Hsp70 family protein [Pontibacter sp. MBLB2868]|uniref:Hsp70 family protein n=1 Tax=Pontibacter sp. MBLB2868 TaxID=3451555 RepID=UPI003F753730